MKRSDEVTAVDNFNDINFFKHRLEKKISLSTTSILLKNLGRAQRMWFLCEKKRPRKKKPVATQGIKFFQFYPWLSSARLSQGAREIPEVTHKLIQSGVLSGRTDVGFQAPRFHLEKSQHHSGTLGRGRKLARQNYLV